MSQRSVDLKAKDNLGRTAFTRTSFSGHKDIVQIQNVHDKIKNIDVNIVEGY